MTTFESMYYIQTLDDTELWYTEEAQEEFVEWHEIYIMQLLIFISHYIKTRIP